MHIVAHGVDLVDIERVARMLAEHGDRFRQRCFTEAEQAYCDSAAVRHAERYAARLAAKEAAMKAIGTGWRDGIAWTDFEVVRLPSGQPSLSVTGTSAGVASELGITDWLVSLSHADRYAMASVIACRKCDDSGRADQG
jgi:holo-[acyl-carrier protein] synthase